MSKLYIVSTPIGNLEDITLRAIETLKKVDIIAAEDTRHTLKLLNRLEIKKSLISYHRHNEEVKTEILIQKIKEGNSIALVSDAGTPGICDPGSEVIKKAIQEDIEVVSVPGPCALISGLICSGIDTNEFQFIGFLSLNKKIRNEKLQELRETKKTTVLYEAPHKLKTTIKDLEEILGDRNVTIAREITKIHEEYIRGTINEVKSKIENIKGEIVIIIEGNKEIAKENKFLDLTLEEHYEIYKKQGFDKKEIVKKMAKDRNVSKNEVYQKFI